MIGKIVEKIDNLLGRYPKYRIFRGGCWMINTQLKTYFRHHFTSRQLNSERTLDNMWDEEFWIHIYYKKSFDKFTQIKFEMNGVVIEDIELEIQRQKREETFKNLL